MSAVRLPHATWLEDTGYPVTVFDAAGAALATLTADAWRSTHIAALCPHGHRHCFACRHRLTNAKGALPPAAKLTDAALLDAIANTG